MRFALLTGAFLGFLTCVKVQLTPTFLQFEQTGEAPLHLTFFWWQKSQA